VLLGFFFPFLLQYVKCIFKSSMLDLTIAGFELVCLNKKKNKKNWKSAFFLHCYFYVCLMAVMIKSDLCRVCGIGSAVYFYNQNFRELRSVCRS